MKFSAPRSFGFSDWKSLKQDPRVSKTKPASPLHSLLKRGGVSETGDGRLQENAGEDQRNGSPVLSLATVGPIQGMSRSLLHAQGLSPSSVLSSLPF